MSLNIITLSQIIRYGNDNGYKFVTKNTNRKRFHVCELKKKIFFVSYRIII